jgi:hypothetical protein
MNEPHRACFALVPFSSFSYANPTLFDSKKSPGPDRDPVGALFLLPLPLLLRLPGLLRPLLPRLVDLDLLLPALLAAEGHVTSAIGKETLISQTIHSLRCEIFQEKKRPIEC